MKMLAPPGRIPNVIDVLSRSNGLSDVRHERAALADHQIDLLLRPPIAGLGALDSKSSGGLIEIGHPQRRRSAGTVGMERPRRQLNERQPLVVMFLIASVAATTGEPYC
jgi:hypothetical protein